MARRSKPHQLTQSQDTLRFSKSAGVFIGLSDVLGSSARVTIHDCEFPLGLMVKELPAMITC